MTAALPIRLEAAAWTDWRFDSLAAALGIRKADAIGRCMELWNWACSRFTKVVPAGPIKTLIGNAAATDFLMDADLVQSTPGGYRIKGSDRWEALWKGCEQRVDRARRGGDARSSAAGARGAGGRFVRHSDSNGDDETPAEAPAMDQPVSSHGPGSLISDLFSLRSEPDQRSEPEAVGKSNPERRAVAPREIGEVSNVVPMTGGIR